MDRIVFPLSPGADGRAVADLQDGLRLLLERRVLEIGDADRDALLAALPDERAATRYGDVTARTVGLFQEQHRLTPTGAVDDQTAARLNGVLERLGAFTDRPDRAPVFVVAGRVTDESGEPVRATVVRAEHVTDLAVIRLGDAETDTDGRYTVQYPPPGDGSPVRLRVVVVDRDGNRRAESSVERDAGPVEVVDVVAPQPPALGRRGRVEGRVILDHGAPADGASLRLYRTGFGGESVELASTTTSATGDYAFDYDPGDRSVTLELRAVTNGQEVPLTRPLTHMGLAGTDRVDLIAPGRVQPADAEYVRLTAAVAPHLGGRGLADARESGERRDLSELNAATGWDARLLALAGTAQQHAADPDVELPAQPLYGLFRAGLPSDPLLLAQVEPTTVRTALERLVGAGIVEMRPADIDGFVKQHESFSVRTRLALPAPGSTATYGDLLAAAGVSAAVANTFAPLYLRHDGDGAALWDRAREAGVDEPSIARLQWQGKLAFLAGNSGPLTAQLMRTLGDDGRASPAELVRRDLHRPESWTIELEAAAAAAGVEVDRVIPVTYVGTPEQRLAAYTDDLARKVRLSYPTQVVAQMVRSNALPVNRAKEATASLLDAAAAEGFRLGRTPVESFLAGRGHLVEGLTGSELLDVKQTVKVLHRISQITPGDAAMTVLAALGLTSAYDVTGLRRGEFVRLFTGKYLEIHGRAPRRVEVELVWRKAHQVSSVTYNLFGAVRKLDSDPALPAISGTPVQRAAQRDELTAALRDYPTMESLFGPLDFAECEHCRSVLSPAAYLVDLLQFLEDEPATWASFLQRWRERNGTEYTDEYDFPYEALEARRPDLPHIQLTCENTNTAMPYIDVVLEILEYYVAERSLAPAAARDTEGATSEELLAEPQHIVVKAYDTLLADRYPLTQPFDLWLETVRRLGEFTDTPLWRVLETFRRTDDLFTTTTGPDRADVFLESLGVSPAERAILTDPNPLASWWTLYGYASAQEAMTEAVDEAGERIDLNSAKAVARRLGVSYAELVDLVRTGFVNPRLPALGVLEKLPASVAELRLLTDAARTFHTANADLLGPDLDAGQRARLAALFDADWQRLLDIDALLGRIGAHAAAFGTTSEAVVAELAALPLGEVLVLADPDAGASFDATVLRFADGRPATPEVFLRIVVLVRLRRTLGWTIEETDRALGLFTPSAAPYAAAHFAKRPLLTTLIHLAHAVELRGKLTGTRIGPAELMTLWSDLPTTGRDPLYARLFLTRGVLKADSVFDHPHGDYLAPAWVTAQGQGKPPEFVLVKGHLTTIRGALGLTATDVTAILTDVSSTLDTARLSLPNVSLLYRYGLLARALRVSVPELVTLKSLTGLDPFRPPYPDPLARLDEDHPYGQTLAFVGIVEDVRRSGFSIADLDFLVRRRFDEAGPHRLDRAATLTLLATLADGVLAIDAEHATPTDPAAVTEETLGAVVGLLLPPEVAARLLRMLRGDETLDDGSRAFFDQFLRRQPVRAADDTGFLDDADYPTLFAPALAAALPGRRLRVAQAFLPVLRERLARDLVTRTLAAQTGADRALAASLATDPRLLRVTTDAGARPPATVIGAAAVAGVDADFFTTPDGTGPRLPTARVVGTVDTATKDLVGGAGQAVGSARFTGYLRVPADGAYRFTVQLAEQGARVRVAMPDLARPLVLEGTAGGDDAEVSTAAPGFVELTAGVPYRFAVTLDQLGGGAARMLVRSETSGTAPLSQLRLFSATALDAAETAHELMTGALLVVQTLGLSEREVRHILVDTATWGVDLSALPTRPTGTSAAEVTAARDLFADILRLSAYTHVRSDVAGGTADLIDVFEAQAGGSAPEVYRLLGRMTRRDPAIVRATAEALVAAPAFATHEPVRRLWDALELVERLGATAGDVRGWTRIVTDPAADRAAIARAVKEAVKARFDAATWLRAAQPIFDDLRRRQRDALAAHVMHRHRFDHRAQLYEHFLLDPDMEPVVQTSRIRVATASVQLFVQRCLLNLEETVHPSAILGADQWEWMKRYRVWEANRKIFLYPENWLEPEFRDEKTDLFTELEGTVLQSDVSADVVEDAFRAYLRGLEDLARLDVVAMHLEESVDAANNTLHVFGRTFGVPHRYFYRRYADRSWSPWTAVTTEVEGDHLVPVVWRDGLWLFWLTFLPKGGAASGGPKDASDLQKLPTVKNEVEVQLHWSRLEDGRWTTAESGGWTPAARDRILKNVGEDFEPEQVSVHVDVVDPPDAGQETPAGAQAPGVYVALTGAVHGTFHMQSRNSPLRTAATRSPTTVPYSVENDASMRRATRFVGKDGGLAVTFTQTVSAEPERVRQGPQLILGQPGQFTLLACDNTLTLTVPPEAYENAEQPEEVRKALQAGMAEIEGLMKPVFFADGTQTFYVEPEVTERTIERWEEWITTTPGPGTTPPTIPELPEFEQLVTPIFPKPTPTPFDPPQHVPDLGSLVQVVDRVDWLVNPTTGLVVDGMVIGRHGAVAEIVAGTADRDLMREPGHRVVAAGAGSALAAGTVIVAPDTAARGADPVPNGLRIVGANGLTESLLQNGQVRR